MNKKIIIPSVLAVIALIVIILIISSSPKKSGPINPRELIKTSVEDWNKRKNNNPEVKVNLNGLHLPKSDLKGIRLSGANLSGSRLFLSNLEGADLSHTNLTGANLSNANLKHARLYKANLSHANFTGADLTKAALRGVIINGRVSFKDCNLTGVELYGLPLGNIILFNANLDKAVVSKRWISYVKRQKVRNFNKIKWIR